MKGQFYGIAGFDGVMFDNYRTSIVLFYSPKPLYFIGLGGNLTLFDNYRRYRGNRKFEEMISMKRCYGIVASMGVNFKDFLLRINYIKGLTNIYESFVDLEPIDSIMIYLTYKFQL